jgi:type II secretory pathway component PulC
MGGAKVRRQTAILSLVGVCGALAAAFLYFAFAPLPDPEPPQVTLPHKHKTILVAQSITMPPPTDFADLDTRPAFNPTRAPIATPQTMSSSETPPDVKVVGVIIDGENRIAMIRVPSSPLATAFRIGAAISGWRIAEIDPDRVVLTSGGLRDEIRLDANRPAKAQ